MSHPPPNPHAYEARKWFQLGVRHLGIASSLVGTFPDGSAFHTYHAFECAISAVIAAKGWLYLQTGKPMVLSEWSITKDQAVKYTAVNS